MKNILCGIAYALSIGLAVAGLTRWVAISIKDPAPTPREPISQTGVMVAGADPIDEDCYCRCRNREAEATMGSFKSHVFDISGDRHAAPSF